MSDISKIDKNFVSGQVDKEDLKSYDVRNEPFKLYGIYAPESGELFRRVPDKVAKEMSDGAYALHTNTAGVRVRFKTDSKYVAIKAKMPWVALMPHMPAVGSAGFDLYADGEFVSSYNPPITYADRFRATFELDGGFEGIIEFADRKMRDIIINFPLYSNVSELLVGLQEDAQLLPGGGYKYKTPVVFYGSSITQGGCASRPGNCYEAVISRRLDTDYINLGFSGNARAEDVIADYIAGLDMSVFIYDYDHNAPTVEHLRKTHKRMFDKIRKAHPDLPVIMISRPNPSVAEEREERIRIIRETYETAKAAGDNNVYFINGQDILNYKDRDMVTCDGVHPNDFGFWCMAEIIGGAVEKVLVK